MDIPSTSYSLLAYIHENGATESAFTHFDGRYRELIHQWCLHAGLAGDAEDATQEILLKLYQALPRHVHDPGRGLFRGWLKTLVQNSLRDWWRKRQRREEPLVVGGSTFLGNLHNFQDPGLQEPGDQDLEESIERLSEAIEQAEESRAAAIIGRVRARVEEKTWRACEIIRYEKRSAAEAARELGLSPATVLRYANRVKKMLEEEVNREAQRSG